MRTSIIRIFHSTLFSLALISCITSCQKETIHSTENADKSFTDINVPAGFDWAMKRNVKLSIGVTDTRFGDAMHVIAIYDDKGKLIGKGSSTITSPFDLNIELPTSVKRVYLIKTAPDGSRTTSDIAVDSKAITTMMSVPDLGKDRGGIKIMDIPETSPDCNSECDLTVQSSVNPVQVIEIPNGQKVCLSGTFPNTKEFILSFLGPNGSIKICGTNVRIRAVQYYNTYDLGGNTKIIVTSGSTVKFVNSTTSRHVLYSTIKNFGQIVFENLSAVDFEHTVINYGAITSSPNAISAFFYENRPVSTEPYRNYGTITNMHFNFHARFSRPGSMVNYGTMSAPTSTVGNFILHNEYVFTNYCTVNGMAIQVHPGCTFYNQSNAYIYSASGGGRLLVASGATFYAGNNSMVQAPELDLSGTIQQLSGSSLIRINGIGYNGNTSKTTINSAAVINGLIRICDQNGVETNNGTLQYGAALSCNQFIPPTACNPAGYGTLTANDTDKDGIINSLDDYPEDASKAFNSPGVSGTLVFEDQWPYRGDYDMNDIVTSYSYTIITNATNKVTQVTGDYTLRAAGGIFANGFGVEFPIARNKVSNISGATLETGQANAVAILFTNQKNEIAGYNTRNSETVVATKTYHMEINFMDPTPFSSFGASSYNPFIWNNGLSISSTPRGKEIHLPGKPMTSLGQAALFGSRDDRSVPANGITFLTQSSYPWALDIPEATFKYPEEGLDIAIPYKKLAAWVESGGVQYTDWYSNPSGEYRHPAALYSW